MKYWFSIAMLWVLMVSCCLAQISETKNTVLPSLTVSPGNATIGTTVLPFSYLPVTYSATPTFAAVASVQAFSMTLTGNVTNSTATGLSVGVAVFKICQDGTGGRTFVWPTGFSQAVTISPVTSVCTIETFSWDGTSTANLIGVTTTGGPAVIVPTQAAPATPSVGFAYCWQDSTQLVWSCKNSSGTVTQSVAGIANPSDTQAINYVGTDGVQHRIAVAGLAGNTFTGVQLYSPGADSTSFFKITNHSPGDPLFNVDTTNFRIGFGTDVPKALLHVAGQAAFGNHVVATFSAAMRLEQTSGDGMQIIHTGGAGKNGLFISSNGDNSIYSAGNISVDLGHRLQCTHGSNATCGVSTLSSGAVTVSTTAVQALAAAGAAGYAIRLTELNCSGTCAGVWLGTVTAGTSFVINGAATDNSNVFWEIVSIL